MIPYHHWVIVLRSDGTQSFVRASENGDIRANKCRALGTQIVGHPFGSTFEFHDDINEPTPPNKQEALDNINKKRAQKGGQPAIKYSKLVRVETTITNGKDEDDDEEEEDMNDNRGFSSNPSNQKANAEALLKQGVKGQALIDVLTANSTTFEMKNKYSKEKFMRKMKRKYLPTVTILRPTARTIAECLFLKHPPGAMNEDVLRSCRWTDALPQLLAFGNIHASSRALVLDGIGGLLSLSIIERLVPRSGSCIFVATCPREYEGGGGRPFLELLNLDKQVLLDTFVVLPACALQADGSVLALPSKKEDGEKRVKLERDGPREEMAEMLNRKQGGSGADSLLIAAKQHPWQALQVLFPHLGLGKPFVIHHPTLEPLMECRAKLSALRNSVLDVVVTETFCREYQNLENRIHPMMTGSATGGYILRGIKVQDWHVGVEEEEVTVVAVEMEEEME